MLAQSSRKYAGHPYLVILVVCYQIEIKFFDDFNFSIQGTMHYDFLPILER